MSSYFALFDSIFRQVLCGQRFRTAVDLKYRNRVGFHAGVHHEYAGKRRVQNQS